MIDHIISENIYKIQSEALTKLMIFITHIGDKYTIAIFSLILTAFFIYKKEYQKTKLFIIAMTLGVALSQAIKHIIQRPRPELMIIAKDGFSFPSGHSTLAIVFFGMIIYLFKDKIKNRKRKYSFIGLNILLILAIAFSRLYLNVHWFTDVISGLLLGAICIFASILATKKISILQKNKLF